MSQHGTLALLVFHPDSTKKESPKLHEIVCDADEVRFLERIAKRGDLPVASTLEEFRSFRLEQSEQFGDYIESMLCSPGVKTEVKDQGIQWLESKLKMDRYAEQEKEAATLIAHFAFEMYCLNPSQKDFWLESQTAKIHIRVFDLPPEKQPEDLKKAV